MLQCGRHLSNYATVRGDIMEHFITSVHINEVRHLKDIEIKLNPEKRQHLILTGKNGSGKTSVLFFGIYLVYFIITYIGFCRNVEEWG